jgi:protease IV
MRRQVRLAITVAILVVPGAIAGYRGAWAVGLLLFAPAAVIVTAFLCLVFLPARIPRDCVLVVRLAGRMREHAAPSPIQQLAGGGFRTLYQLRQALEAAKTDRRVRAVIVEIAGLQTGFGTACEVHDLLKEIRDAGKRVIAVLAGDNTTVREYLVAAGAGEIIANPDTSMMLIGVAAGNFFLKGALDKLKVEAQTLQWKEYKGAAEIFSRDAMSPELRESIEAIVADWLSTCGDKIAAARKLDRQRARALLAGGFLSARAAGEAGLVDRVGYVEDLRGEFDPQDTGRTFVGLSRYLRHVAYSRRIPSARIALVHGVGPVIVGESPPAGDFLSAERVAGNLKRAARDKRIRAIVFRVNSPGGSAVGSDLVWRAVQEVRKRGKPLVVSMGDVAGSGGYYVAAGADAIVAEPTTVTGSIGVVYTKLNLSRLLEELGIRIDWAKSDHLGDSLSASRAMTDSELAQLNRMVGELYTNFTAKVAQGRKLDSERAEQAAKGRVWTGTAALEKGLVDELGGLGRAVQIAREKAGLKPHQTHELIPIPGPSLISGLRLALMGAQTAAPLGLAAQVLGIPAEWAPAMVQLLMTSRALLLCPFFD